MRKSNAVALGVACGIIATMVACNGNKAKISGHFLGCESKAVILEEVSADRVSVVDSTVTDSKGNFKFRVELSSPEPTLYNIRINGSSIIPILTAPGDRIEVQSIYYKPESYSVSGSEESILIKEIFDIFNDGMSRLDSIASERSLYEPSAADRREAMREYVREYNAIKQEQVHFIVRNSGSLAAVYALGLRLPNDNTLFNGDSDIIYYRMVADSVQKSYPNSMYLASLREAIDSYDKAAQLVQSLVESVDHPASYPDIELNDMYGNVQRLSANHRKVTLLDFWSAADPSFVINNADLKELYDIYSPHGFEIYQVNVDDSKQVWVNAVQKQNLPWISVCDFNGPSGRAVATYNIGRLPANYLIDSSGDIVGKNLFGEDLRKELDRYIKGSSIEDAVM